MYKNTQKKIEKYIIIKCHNNECLHSVTYRNTCKCPVLEEVTHFKYLGIYLDSKLSWDIHVGDVMKKLRICAAQFYKLKFILDYKNLKIVYDALVQSILKYGIQCYGQCSVTNKIKIETLNNQIVKTIMKKNYNNETNNILTFNNLFEYTIIIEYYYREGIRKRENKMYNIRNNKFDIPLTFNKYGDRKIEVLIPKIFNKIPDELSNISKISLVKKKVRKWLMEKDK